MKRSLAAAAALLVLFGLAGCSSAPTAPDDTGPVVHSPVLDFTATPSTVQSGGEVVLKFTTRYTNTVIIRVGDTILQTSDREQFVNLDVAWEGTLRVYPTATTVYVATAYGDTQFARSLTVTVTP